MCDACGGSGRRKATPGEMAADLVRDGFAVGVTFCSVCRGVGRISDRMPAADAIADAETLRLYTASFRGGPHWAIRNRERALLLSLSPDRASYEWAPGWAAKQAHDAFRAVPGLRG
jgi:hypothetical protein